MKTRKNGFTLVEIMIAMFILSFLSLFTVQAIQKALQSKTKVQKDIDKSSTMRDALRVMERDINLAFNYTDIYAKLYNDAQDERKKKAQQPAPVTPGSSSQQVTPPVVPPQQLNPVDEAKYKHKETKSWTNFIGEPESLSFTSLSNIRMMEDTPISSQAEIGYHIKSCRRRSTQEQSSKCLWRRVSNYIHEDITKEGEETVLMENITEFKLRYLGPGTEEEWQDTWMSNERGDDKTKGKFPYAVEITIEVKDPNPAAKDKTLRMTTVASIRNPNNPPKPVADPNAPAP